MGIAKSSQVAQPVQVQPVSTPQTTYIPHEIDSVPIDVYAFFGVDGFNSDERLRGKLKDITEWMKDGTETLGDGMTKLRNLETKLGMGGYERKYDKIWNWCRLQRNITDLRKRQEALEKPKWD